MYQYIKNFDNTIRTDLIYKTDTKLWIPNDPKNRDWVAYQAWLAAGNTPIAAA